MELRRGLMMQMAKAANVLHGTITLDDNQQTIQISVPFEPKLCMISLRQMDSSDTQYRSIFEIVGFFENTQNVANPFAVTGGVCYEADGIYNGSARTSQLMLPTYANGIVTLFSRSGSITWAKGTYDYIIAG